MYLDCHAEAQSKYPLDLSLLRYPTTPPLSNTLIAACGQDDLSSARTASFPSKARVAGFLLNADIGPTSYGVLYSIAPGEQGEFVQVDVIGIDHYAGHDIIRVAAGVAYAIVGYAGHAQERGLSHLKEHIAVNADWYAARSLSAAVPWLHAEPMVKHLEASWRGRLSQLKADSRIAALLQAQEHLASR